MTTTIPKSSRKRVLLDSNVWRYVLDSGSAGKLIRLAKSDSAAIQIAPAVVYEALRLKDSRTRDALVKLMTHASFERLMPEAYSESVEIIHEIKRLHLDWLSHKPDIKHLRRLELDWRKRTGGFWVRTKRWPKREAGYLEVVEEDMIYHGIKQSKNARREMMESDWKRNPPMDKTMATFRESVPGWRGDQIEAWRADSWKIVTFALTQVGSAYRDWMGPLLDLRSGLLRSAEWNAFWLYEIDKTEAPRQWLRWAFTFAQRFRKVTSGTPADSQLGTYFLETDLVISADRILMDILEEVRPYAPCPLPRGKLIRGGDEGVADLFDTLAQ